LTVEERRHDEVLAGVRHIREMVEALIVDVRDLLIEERTHGGPGKGD
jgi:hypothetical protein